MRSIADIATHGDPEQLTEVGFVQPVTTEPVSQDAVHRRDDPRFQPSDSRSRCARDVSSPPTTPTSFPNATCVAWQPDKMGPAVDATGIRPTLVRQRAQAMLGLAVGAGKKPRTSRSAHSGGIQPPGAARAPVVPSMPQHVMDTTSRPSDSQ